MVSKNEKPSINIPKPKPKPEKKSLTAEEKFAIWKKARKDAYDEKKEIWNKYDSFIQQAMSEMKKYLQKYDNFNSELCPDWIWIKSMLWTEGHPVDFEYDWAHRPLRIAVAGDAGAPALLNKDEAISLVIPTGVEWQNLTLSKITNDPYSNIRAAIIYLMNKLSLSDQISVDDPNDKTIYTVKVSTADGHGTMDAIALDRRRIGTTKEILERENPGVNPTRLHNGQELRYCKGSKQRVIFGWRFPVNAKIIAQQYNGGGDAAYEAKVDYVHSLLSGSMGREK